MSETFYLQINFLERKLEQQKDSAKLHYRNITRELLSVITTHDLLQNESTVPIAKSLIHIIYEMELLA